MGSAIETRARSGARQLAALAGFGLATALVAWAGSLVTRGATDSAWFEQLTKPSFYPPSEIFGIAASN